MSRRPANWPPLYLAPLALLLVAAVQLIRVETQHLTAWKGGGFGMFSSLDLIRVVRVHVTTDEGEAVVPLPDLPILKARLLAAPDMPALERVASRALERDWVLLDYDEMVAGAAGLPEEVRSGIIRSETNRELRSKEWKAYPDLAAFAVPEGAPPGFGRSPSAARVVVYAARYEPQEQRLVFEPLNELVVEAPP
jgi:hypothetical protein